MTDRHEDGNCERCFWRGRAERAEETVARVKKWAGHQPIVLSEYGTGYSQAQQHAFDLITGEAVLDD